MRLIQRLSPCARLRDERGFTMIIALATLVIVLGLTMAAFAAVNNDFPLAANDSLQKQAYSTAQAGIQRYLYDLDQNSEYWTQCIPTSSTWVNNPSTNPATLNYATVSGTSNQRYAVELLPAAGQTTYTQCNVNNPVASMIQATGNGAGTIRIRSTGYAGTVRRTLVANLREQSFLDYEWFTNYETSDPLLQVAFAYQASLSPPPADTTIEPPDLCALNPSSGCGSGYSAALTGAQAQCVQYRFGPPPAATTTAGYDRYTNNNAGYGTGAFYKDSNGTYSCDAINFITADSINGPFHSNDEIQLCGSPTFGRTLADNIEFSGPSPGYVQSCTGTPIIHGTQPSPVNNLTAPPSNASLKTVAAAAYTFTGTTCITLSATAITYSQPNSAYPSCFSSGIPTTSVAYPSNGVLYVKNGTCSLSYDVENPSYTSNTGCGTVYVQGTDGPPLTISAENDIVIDGNLLYSNSSTSLLGLIANNFVRVYHPIGNQPLGTNNPACPSSGDSAVLKNLTINAMLMSLNHSFVVDQYNCGTGLGTLTVNGGIAQNFRGPVGTGSGGSVSTGYAKSYTYDDRLRYEEPPHFIDPVQGSWRIQRQTECDTATAC
jgi:Tfp pilus assembly protein PilX